MQIVRRDTVRSQWPRSLSRRATAARLLKSWVRMFVACVVLSGRGHCDELITRPEDSTDCGASLCVIKKPRGRGGHSPRWATPEKIINYIYIYVVYTSV
jgi:hypothetical protein